MITPILIPIKTEREKCKNCNQDLYIKRACKGCGHEIERDDIGFPYWYVSIILNIITIYAGAYIFKLIPMFEWYSMPTFFILCIFGIAVIVLSWEILSK